MAHIHELYDFVIVIYIVHNNKILLVNHPRYGVWVAPGGHIELDEEPEEALYREVKEETGLEIELITKNPAVGLPSGKLLAGPNFIDVHEANPPHKHIGLVYFARSKNDKFTKSAEHTDMRWFTESELDDPSYNIPISAKYCSKEALKAA